MGVLAAILAKIVGPVLAQSIVGAVGEMLTALRLRRQDEDRISAHQRAERLQARVDALEREASLAREARDAEIEAARKHAQSDGDDAFDRDFERKG